MEENFLFEVTHTGLFRIKESSVLLLSDSENMCVNSYK
jgi:hypothetical protein